MNTIQDGGPAFPHGPLGDTMHGEDGRVWHQYQAGAGMSLRDWFAGQALAGLVSSWYDRYANDPATQRGSGPANIALAAYVHADAMLAAREKGTE